MRIGIDEAGRGAWAGPLVAAAVALNKPIKGLKDSKQLTPKKRQELYELIAENAHIGIGQVSPEEIDEHGLTWTQTKAMKQALSTLEHKDMEIIVDGRIDYIGLPNSKAVVRADSKYAEVMAASIVAKVWRDKLMAKIAMDLPGYGFASHKGYGTRAHTVALNKLGVSHQHRASYKPIAALL